MRRLLSGGLLLLAAHADVTAFSVKFMTYNCHEGPFPNEVMQLVANHSPDIIGFQETYRIYKAMQLNPLSSPYDVYLFGVPSEISSNIPIFFKKDLFRIDSTDFGKFQLSDTPDSLLPSYGGPTRQLAWRAVEWVRLVHKPSGHGIYVFNTHWHWSGDINYPGGTAGYEKRQYDNAVLVGRYVAKRKDKNATVVFTCDCNRTEDQPPMQYLYGNNPASPVKFIDTYRELHKTFSGRKIDFVLIQSPRNYKVTEAKIILDKINGVAPSDHEPVTAVIEFDGPAGLSRGESAHPGILPRFRARLGSGSGEIAVPKGYRSLDLYSVRGELLGKFTPP